MNSGHIYFVNFKSGWCGYNIKTIYFDDYNFASFLKNRYLNGKSKYLVLFTFNDERMIYGGLLDFDYLNNLNECEYMNYIQNNLKYIVNKYKERYLLIEKELDLKFVTLI
jgi:hypothetical protein